MTVPVVELIAKYAILMLSAFWYYTCKLLLLLLMVSVNPRHFVAVMLQWLFG